MVFFYLIHPKADLLLKPSAIVKAIKKQWLGLIPSLVTASFLIGICLNGLTTVLTYNFSSSQVDPTPIFIMPVVFGGLTLFFILSGGIQLLLASFHKDYTLWTILGADSQQLASLIGEQLFILALIASFFGSFLSYFATPFIYNWLQGIVGTTMLPSLTFSFHFSAFLESVLIIALISGLSGYHYASKIFNKNQKDLFTEQRQNAKSTINQKIIWFIILMIDLVGVGVIWFFPISYHPTLAGTVEAQLLFFLIFSNLLLLNLTAEIFPAQLLNLWTKLIPDNKSGIITYAKGKVIANKKYLKSIVIPLVTGIALISNFSAISTNISRFYQKDSQLEFFVSFILYLATPILLIGMNVVTITLISIPQEEKEIQQLTQLGFSKKI